VSRAPIEAVTFDAAGTLLFPDPSVGAIYAEVLASHGLKIDPGELDSSFRRAFASAQKDTSIDDSEAREYGYWKEIVSQSIQDHAPLPQYFEALFQELWTEFAKGSRWRLDSDAAPVFDFLDQTSIPFALLTNWDRRVYPVLEDHGIIHRFSNIFVSSELEREKPDPLLFNHVAKSMRTAPQRILHVGDCFDRDARGALGAGFQSAWINASSKTPPKGARKLSRLSELKTLFATGA